MCEACPPIIMGGSGGRDVRVPQEMFGKTLDFDGILTLIANL